MNHDVEESSAPRNAESMQGFGAQTPVPVLPIGASSSALDAVACTLSDGTALVIDARSVKRPQFAACDVGAYEYDGDYIFADGLE